MVLTAPNLSRNRPPYLKKLQAASRAVMMAPVMPWRWRALRCGAAAGA